MAKKTINSQAATILGISGTDTVNTKVLHMVSNAFVGSVTIKARHRHDENSLGATVPAALTALPIPYRRLNVGGVVSDGDYSNVAITDSGIIEVQGDGMEIIADCTAYTSGSMDIYFRDILG